MFQTLLQVLIVITGTSAAVTPNCLSVLVSDSCYDIQQAGQKLASELKTADSLIQLTVFKSIDEARLILSASMEYLKSQLQGVKVSPPSSDPLDHTAIANLENSIFASISQILHQSYLNLLNIIRRASQVSLQTDVIARILFHSASSPTPGRRRRDNPSVNSIDGAVTSLLEDVKQILLAVDAKVKSEAQKIFDLFTASFKTLLNGVTRIKFDEMEANLENYLQKAAGQIATAILPHCRRSIIQIVKQIEVIESATRKLQHDSKALDIALDPAKKLVDEALESTVSSRDVTHVQKKISSFIASLINDYEDIKKFVT